MQRLDYHLTVQKDGTVLAELIDGEKSMFSLPGTLNLASLEVITQDYHLPLLEGVSKQTRRQLKRFGELLYELLFVSPIRGHFEELAWRKIAEQSDDYHLALSLTLQEDLRADVVALPWELLYCTRGNAFLAADPRVSFSRRYAGSVSLAIKALVDDPPLRVLLVRLQPQGVARVALTPISNELSDLAHTHVNILEPIVLENPDPLEMEDALQKYRPHIVHLLIHGRFDERGTDFALVDSSGQVRWYGDRSLADLFTNKWHPRLVLLQACEGGRSSDLLSFANGGAWLVRNHIPAVIAMNYPITNRVGWTFAQTLYTRLVAGDDLDSSVQQARRALAKLDTNAQVRDDYTNRDFAAPILWMQPNVRQIFGQQETHQETLADGVTPINLTITTPDGEQYKTDVAADTFVDQLLQDLLRQWQPAKGDSQRSQRYSLQRILDRSSTLQEVGLPSKADLVLVSKLLEPDAPISLMIKNEQGEQYTTAILVSTEVGQLAADFLQNKPGTGEVIVEWCRSTTETVPLRLDLSFYDQGVSDDALLRIYRVSTLVEE